MINETLKENLEPLINQFEFDEINNQVNYQSVIIITKQLAKTTNDSETEKQITTRVNFFNKIKYCFPLGRVESLGFYKSYVLKCGQFLTGKRDFRSNGDILKYIVLGILLDIGIYYFTKSIFPFYLLISTLTLTFIGWRQELETKKEQIFCNRI